MSGFSTLGRVGAAAGDLSGSFPNPVVTAIQGVPIDPRIPDNGDTLVYNGGEWIPTPSPANTAALFKGVWDASTNTPDIENYPGLSDGFTWLVQVAGNTNINGITDWKVGDYAIYSGGNWYKLSNSSFGWGLTGNAGTIPTVNYVGTSDEHDLSIRANGIEGFRVLWAGGTLATGNMEIDGALNVVGNVTGSNAKLTGDLAVCGGDITTNAPVFNLLNGATTRINMGNSAACNWISGSTKFPQGISGSLTRLTDGTSAFVALTGMIITSASNGAVSFAIDDSKVATLSGSTFSGPVVFNAGLSGSLTKLSDGTSAFIAGTGILVSSASNGAVTITMSNTGSAGTYGSQSQVPVFSSDAQGRVTSVTNTSIAINASQVVAGTFPSSVSVQNIYQDVTSQVSGGSTALAYGEVVYFTPSGGSATNPAVNRALATSASTAATTIGLVSSTTIPNGNAGQIITKGVLVGNPLGSPPYLNTNGFTQGDLLYVDPTTAGVLTNVRPSYPNFAIPVGIVIVKNQYAGAIYVDPSVGYNAADIVKIPAPSAKRTESAPATTSILSTWFNGPPAISYLALDFSGAGNVTLSAGPIQAQTTADYGRILWIHNVSTKTITFNAGGTTYLSGGVNLVLQPNSLVQFMWSFVGGGAGRWLQMGSPITY